jgi:hypothetical protein
LQMCRDHTYHGHHLYHKVVHEIICRIARVVRLGKRKRSTSPTTVALMQTKIPPFYMQSPCGCWLRYSNCPVQGDVMESRGVDP